MAKTTRTTYFVRGGSKQGAYLKLRTKQPVWATTPLKYAWTNRKDTLVELTYEQARNAIRNGYGGTLVKRVYDGKTLISESVVTA